MTPEARKEYQKLYHQKNKERRNKLIEENRRTRKARDPEAFRAKCNAAHKRWKKKNPGKFAEYQKVYYKKHPDALLRINLKRYYGLSLEEGRAILGQGCMICSGVATCIDHIHGSKIVRGGLCASCNGGLGMFKDSVERLRSAIDYLSFNLSHENRRRGEEKS